MIDFIFQVDFSTIYIILRRDFASPSDVHGVLTTPLGGGFYYSSADANEAARQHCLREAAKGFTFLGEDAVHGMKKGLYRGACITRELERERFEVQVRRLRARGGMRYDRRSVAGRAQGRASTGLNLTAEEENKDVEEIRSSRSSSVLGQRRSRMARLWKTIKRK